MMLRYTVDPDRIAANRRRNLVHAGILIGALAALLAAVGWFIAGVVGLVWIATFAVLVLYFGPQVSQRLMLQIYSATPLDRRQVPMLYDVVNDLCERSGITAKVSLFYIPSRLMLAFTVGGRNEVSLALSDGLLRRLTGREIAGVMAHELSHVAHGDLKLMALADFITKVTRTLAFIAMLLILINLPYIAEGEVAIPWPPIALLAFAPILSLLLQLGLSRSREYDADAGAALLTGDPEGIATALQKMDAQQQRYWENVFGRQGVLNQPSILRTHPKTEERVRKLQEMAVPRDEGPDLPDDFLPDDYDEVSHTPRRRYHGFRY
ncbi:peptidase M48 [Ferruginivarius sediminum]|uniref:Peptidase M48 n=2 Tax=Ferruginivarius sediminum TaxID=2661937 RepID=A0A369TGG2_9PROT|nr:peptidase M48 [Ferruginivarius sediminum]